MFGLMIHMVLAWLKPSCQVLQVIQVFFVAGNYERVLVKAPISVVQRSGQRSTSENASTFVQITCTNHPKQP